MISYLFRRDFWLEQQILLTNIVVLLFFSLFVRFWKEEVIWLKAMQMI